MPRKAGAYSPTQLAEWRERILVGKAIDALNQAIEGKIDLTTARMKAIEIALRKTLPDLSSVELSGNPDKASYLHLGAGKAVISRILTIMRQPEFNVFQCLSNLRQD